MTESPTNSEDSVFDATPYLKLVIDRDGRWFQNGAEIIHPQIYATFCQALERTDDDGYRIRIGKETCRVEVEDAPFVVQRIFSGDADRLFIQLNDGTTEVFEPENFWIGERNIPYTVVKQGLFHARLSRPAYYELAKYVIVEEDEQAFFLLDGRRTRVKHEPESG